jgi:hypothetical protein
MLRVLTNDEAAELIPHRIPHKAQTIIVAGKAEQGKTYLLRRYLSELEPRVLAFDPYNNFRWIREASIDVAFRDLEEFYAVRRRVVPPFDADTEAWAERIFVRIRKDKVRDLLLELDEISEWVNYRREPSAALKKIALQGRQIGLRTIVASQILSYIPAPFQSMATDLVVFQTTRPADLDVLAKWSKELAERAPSLQPRQCFYLSL